MVEKRIHHNAHWLSKYALGSVNMLSEALAECERLSEVVRVGEVGLEGGRFTMGTLSMALESFRSTSARRVEVYRLDLHQQYQEMINYLKTEPNSYMKNLANIHTYFAYGSIQEAIFAPCSLNVIHFSHLLSASRVRESAPDTLIPSFSEDQEYLIRRKQYASEDFLSVLDKRYEELLPGGRIVFDVLAYPEQGISMFSLLDSTFKEFRDALPENFGLIPHFRTPEEVEEDLRKLSSKFRLIAQDQKDVPMPQYEEFLKDNDAEKYAEQLAIFWRYALSFELNRYISSPEKVIEILDSLLEAFKRKCIENPPIVIGSAHYLSLEKLS